MLSSIGIQRLPDRLKYLVQKHRSKENEINKEETSYLEDEETKLTENKEQRKIFSLLKYEDQRIMLKLEVKTNHLMEAKKERRMLYMQ